MISVIVTTYNRPRLLMERAIPSILAQTNGDWECHVVGDGTDDETTAVMTALCARDGRFRYTNLPHQSYPDDPGAKWCALGHEAINFGLDHALGEWVSALADDDEYTPDAFEVLTRRAAQGDVDFVYGRSVTPWGQGYGFWPPSAMNFTEGSYIYRSGLGYRYDSAGCLARGLPGDADLWIRMIEGGVRFAFVDHLVHRYYPSARS